MDKGLMGGQPENTQEQIIEASIRPQILRDYLGQKEVKDQMELFIQAAKKRGESLDHVLIFGPPGLGKTTMAHVAALLTNLQPHDVLFIDEIHRLSPVVEEVLYPAMEDFQIDIMIGEGPAARSIKLDLPPFTLVGATTRAGLLTSPLRDRFGIVQRLKFYNTEDLTQIVARSAKILNIEADQAGCMEVARRSRGTPRIANRLLRRVRDFAEVKGDGVITEAIAAAAMNMLQVDQKGLDEMDRKLLEIITQQFEGGPVGINSLAAALSEERGTVEDVIEPYLIQQGLIARTARGRIATAKTWQTMGIDPPKSKINQDMFE